MTSEWRPLESTASHFESNVEGIPVWLEDPLMDWLKRALRPGFGEMESWALDTVRDFDSRSQNRSPIAPTFSPYEIGAIRDSMNESEYLSFIDYIAYASSLPNAFGGQNDKLDDILRKGSSAWCVGQRAGQVGLERRVQPSVLSAATMAMQNTGRAGELLSEAWHCAFGRNPDPEKSYSKTIKALEAAASRVVCPNDKTTVLSKVIGQMRRDGNWTIPLDAAHDQNPLPIVLLNMMQAIVSGQTDRHAGNGVEAPTSQRAAETAVLLAVPLIQWFSSDAVAQQPIRYLADRQQIGIKHLPR